MEYEIFLIESNEGPSLRSEESSKYEAIVKNITISLKTKAISFLQLIQRVNLTKGKHVRLQWCSPCNMTETYKWDKTFQFKWKQTKLIDNVILVFCKLVADKNTLEITNETTNTRSAFKTLSNIYNGTFLWEYLATFSHVFAKKLTIINVWQGPKYVSSSNSESLTLFFPRFHFDPPENIKKP